MFTWKQWYMITIDTELNNMFCLTMFHWVIPRTYYWISEGIFRHGCQTCQCCTCQQPLVGRLVNILPVGHTHFDTRKISQMCQRLLGRMLFIDIRMGCVQESFLIIKLVSAKISKQSVSWKANEKVIKNNRVNVIGWVKNSARRKNINNHKKQKCNYTT